MVERVSGSKVMGYNPYLSIFMVVDDMYDIYANSPHLANIGLVRGPISRVIWLQSLHFF